MNGKVAEGEVTCAGSPQVHGGAQDMLTDQKQSEDIFVMYPNQVFSMNKNFIQKSKY